MKKPILIATGVLVVLILLTVASLFLIPGLNNNSTDNAGEDINANLASVLSDSTYRGNPGAVPDGFYYMEQEASNPTTKYVLLEDICKQFSQQYMQNILGKTVYSIKPASEPTLYNCTYYLNAQKNDYIMLILDYLNVADQKAGLETLGYTLKTDSRIPMGHFISYNDQGKINDTYFVLGDNKFLRLTRASTQTLTETETLDLSVKLGEKMKNFQ